ncbi:MAG: hypothetical protein LBT10_09115 [Methanobrevibacter sp.]|jgi:uncharacterized C2H2 Zn-finger protein|nr:hypothetical protein [Methanobrevibacter sp.]
MKTKTEIPHNNVYAEGIFKDNVNIENNVLFIKPIVPFYLVRALVKFIEEITKIVYWDGENLKCPVCGRKLYRNSYSKKWINKTHLVHRQKYICSNKECDYEHVTNIDHIVPKHCNYEIEIRNEPYKQGLIDYKSLEKISEHIKNNYGANPSRQSALNFYRETDSTLKKLETEVLKYDKNELSNVIAIDEQFPRVNGEKKAKSVIMDIGTNLILSDEIIPVKDLTPEFNEQTIKNTIKGIDVKGIVTDGDKSYAPIADSLNIIHQHCNFHLKKNLMDELNKILNKIKRKRKSLDRQIKDITLNLPFKEK